MQLDDSLDGRRSQPVSSTGVSTGSVAKRRASSSMMLGRGSSSNTPIPRRASSSLSIFSTTPFAADASHPPVSQHSNGFAKSFPQRLMDMLILTSTPSSVHYTDCIEWLPHGKSFSIRDPDRFSSEVLPHFFKQTKYKSFTRKLYRWGFRQITKGEDANSFFHEHFRRDDPESCVKLRVHYSERELQTQAENSAAARRRSAGTGGGPATARRSSATNRRASYQSPLAEETQVGPAINSISARKPARRGSINEDDDAAVMAQIQRVAAAMSASTAVSSSRGSLTGQQQGGLMGRVGVARRQNSYLSHRSSVSSVGSILDSIHGPGGAGPVDGGSSLPEYADGRVSFTSSRTSHDIEEEDNLLTAANLGALSLAPLIDSAPHRHNRGHRDSFASVGKGVSSVLDMKSGSGGGVGTSASLLPTSPIPKEDVDAFLCHAQEGGIDNPSNAALPSASSSTSQPIHADRVSALASAELLEQNRLVDALLAEKEMQLRHQRRVLAEQRQATVWRAVQQQQQQQQQRGTPMMGGVPNTAVGDSIEKQGGEMLGRGPQVHCPLQPPPGGAAPGMDMGPQLATGMMSLPTGCGLRGTGEVGGGGLHDFPGTSLRQTFNSVNTLNVEARIVTQQQADANMAQEQQHQHAPQETREQQLVMADRTPSSEEAQFDNER